MAYPTREQIAEAVEALRLEYPPWRRTPAIDAVLALFPKPTGDEHHTLDELYEYRMLYNALAANGWAAHGTYPVVKSWRHSDGEECFGGGWFIVVATLPTGQVANHYKAEFWDLFTVPEVETPPEYDGHTPAEAARRMHALLSQPTPNAEGECVECPRCKGYGVDPSVQRAGDKVIDCIRCGGAGEVEPPRTAAAPPSIADMVPGDAAAATRHKAEMSAVHAVQAWAEDALITNTPDVREAARDVLAIITSNRARKDD